MRLFLVAIFECDLKNYEKWFSSWAATAKSPGKSFLPGPEATTVSGPPSKISFAKIQNEQLTYQKGPSKIVKKSLREIQAEELSKSKSFK